MAKEMIAMLLAGGQGSRLYALTQKLAKPAVPFGGKYRIIDFPLSNCVNSGIDTVGIGFTTASEIGIWDIFPELVQSVFSANVVAVVFVVSVFLSLVLPKDMDIKTLEG